MMLDPDVETPMKIIVSARLGPLIRTNIASTVEVAQTARLLGRDVLPVDARYEDGDVTCEG